MPTHQTTESMIPLMPCTAYKETVEFYSALGFAITHQQEEPYVYIAASHGGINLHFSGSLGVYQAKNAFGSCLVFVDAVETYYQAFADALRTNYGKVPTANLPRLTRLKAGQTRFTVFDPSGNLLIFINHNEPEMTYSEQDETLSEMAKALGNAEFLRDTYANDKAAARVLDLALERNPSATPIDRARVLAARAELAVAMGDAPLAQSLRDELQQISLSADEHDHFCHELQAADALARWLS